MKLKKKLLISSMLLLSSCSWNEFKDDWKHPEVNKIEIQKCRNTGLSDYKEIKKCIIDNRRNNRTQLQIAIDKGLSDALAHITDELINLKMRDPSMAIDLNNHNHDKKPFDVNDRIESKLIDVDVDIADRKDCMGRWCFDYRPLDINITLPEDISNVLKGHRTRLEKYLNYYSRHVQNDIRH